MDNQYHTYILGLFAATSPYCVDDINTIDKVCSELGILLPCHIRFKAAALSCLISNDLKAQLAKGLYLGFVHKIENTKATIILLEALTWKRLRLELPIAEISQLEIKDLFVISEFDWQSPIDYSWIKASNYTKWDDYKYGKVNSEVEDELVAQSEFVDDYLRTNWLIFQNENT